MIKKNINDFIKSLKNPKYRNMEVLCLIGLASIFVIAGLAFSIRALMSTPNKAEKLEYIDDGIKYISIKDGYITEKLTVEAGDELPGLAAYFNDNYKLDNDASISYYDGDDDLAVNDFTYEKDDSVYVRGIRNIKALIKNNSEEYETKLVIKDTQKPTVQFQNVEITEGEAIDPSKFVAIFVDNSQIVDFDATIVGTDEYVKVGNYDLQVNVCDKANNCVVGSTKLNIKQKEEVIEEDISSFETDSDESPETPEEPDKPNEPDKPVAIPAPKVTRIKLSKGTLSPTFKSSTTSYKATVANSVSSVKITANAASGSSFVSGYGSRTVKLKVGSNTVYIKVKNKDKKTVSYKIVITRKKATTTGGGTGGGTTTEDPTTPEQPRVFVERRTSKNFPYKATNHYGTIEYNMASEVTYNLYSDGYIEVIDFDGSIWTEWDFSNFKTNISAMKSEAKAVLSANPSTRQYFLQQTNKTRSAAGVGIVTLDYDLCVIATMRTFELTYGNTLTHNRPNGKRFYTIIKEYGFKPGKYTDGISHYGENMAYWQLDDASAYTALIASDGHRANIVDKRWKKMGVGVFTFAGRKYWIQLFTT